MDSDGNGTVDASEFQDLISMLQVRVHALRARASVHGRCFARDEPPRSLLPPPQGTSTAAAGPINGPHAGVSKAPGNRLGRGSNHPSS